MNGKGGSALQDNHHEQRKRVPLPLDRQTLDQLRMDCAFGDGTENPIFLTAGAAEAVGDGFWGLMFEFMTFDDWDPDWDPDGLHEIGVIPFDGTDIMFKITPVDTSYKNFTLTFLLPEEW